MAEEDEDGCEPGLRPKKIQKNKAEGRRLPVESAVDEETASLLDWSSKQGRVLTGGGVAETLYTAARGFPFEAAELPHHHLARGTTHAAFAAWRAAGRVCPLIAGVWNRPLFVGGMEHSSDAEEIVYNTQTPSLFVDLRIPKARPPSFKAAGHVSTATLSDRELRLFARQHCFAGYSLLEQGQPSASSEKETGGTPPPALPVVTRHHAIDWNFVDPDSTPRLRPNKWYVEMGRGGGGGGGASPGATQPGTASPVSVWKELSYALDARGQHYYMERWERRAGDHHLFFEAADQGGGDSDGGGAAATQGQRKGPVLALRTAQGSARDKILLVCGGHFAIARARATPPPSTRGGSGGGGGGSLVGLVDAALERGDRAAAEALLTVEGCHGTIDSRPRASPRGLGAAAALESEAPAAAAAAAAVAPQMRWVVDAATHPWQEGRTPPELEMVLPGVEAANAAQREGRSPQSTPFVRVAGKEAWAAQGKAPGNDDGAGASGGGSGSRGSESPLPASLRWTVHGLGGDEWDVLDCSFPAPLELERFLNQAVYRATPAL